MVNIEIDDEVFNYLKSLAEPFIDTPNTVLRRLLFHKDKPQEAPSGSRSTAKSTDSVEASSEAFTTSFLRERYGEGFRVKSPFRTMFESERHLIYFQNFNKIGTANLWYRLSESSLKALRKTTKTATICFTNPSENLVIEVPMKDLDAQVARSTWKKEFLEVNIDPADLRWREIDWNLQKYLVKRGAPNDTSS
jgi:hypothetical protein